MGKPGPKKGAKNAGRPRKPGGLGQEKVKRKQSSLKGFLGKSDNEEEVDEDKAPQRNTQDQQQVTAAAKQKESIDVESDEEKVTKEVENEAAENADADRDADEDDDEAPPSKAKQQPKAKENGNNDQIPNTGATSRVPPNPYLQGMKTTRLRQQSTADSSRKKTSAIASGNSDRADGDGGDGPDGTQQPAVTVGDPREREPSWSPSHLEYFRVMKTHLQKEVKLVPTPGKTKVVGKWPVWARGIIDPRKDPMSFNKEFVNKGILSRDDFSLVPLLFCCPEAQFPEFYPRGTPLCIWCKKYDCVKGLGWGQYPRHGYDTDGVTAIWGKRYKCEDRERAGNEPYSFQAYSAESMALAPLYVRGWWRQNGFRCTWRGAIRWHLIDDMRSDIVNGMSFLGLQRRIEEH